ncbi:MAG: AI-2E family transporter [Clostridia bacterium]|nr:AI-2E family transporter [Clostridia bacterium]
MWYQSKFFKYMTGLLLILLSIFLLGKVEFFLVPFKNLIAILFFPILISGLLYYLFRPVVNLFEKLRIPRTLAILSTFLIFIGLLTAMAVYSGSIIRSEISDFREDFPKIFQATKEKTQDILKDERFGFIISGDFKAQAKDFLQKVIPFIGNGIFGTLSAITNIATTLVVVPFILFYFLRDGSAFPRNVLRFIPERFKQNVREFLEESDKALSAYITGQAIIAFVIGVLMYIGYLIIGLKYSLILALFALLTSFIPLLGTVLGVIPAILVGLSVNPVMVVKILVIMVIVQQLEGNFISPLLIGKQLKIHPLTLIILFLVSGSLFGFIGMLIIVPLYSISKIAVNIIMKVYNMRNFRHIAP